MLAPMIKEKPVAIEKNAVAEGMSRMMGRGNKRTIPRQPGPSSLYGAGWVFSLKGRRSAPLTLPRRTRLYPIRPNLAPPNCTSPRLALSTLQREQQGTPKCSVLPSAAINKPSHTRPHQTEPCLAPLHLAGTQRAIPQLLPCESSRGARRLLCCRLQLKPCQTTTMPIQIMSSQVGP